MIKIIGIGLICFIGGFLLSMIIFKKKNTENALIKLLSDFRTTIED